MNLADEFILCRDALARAFMFLEGDDIIVPKETLESISQALDRATKIADELSKKKQHKWIAGYCSLCGVDADIEISEYCCGAKPAKENDDV